MQTLKRSIWTWLYITMPFYWRRGMAQFTDASTPNFLIIGTQRGGTTSAFNYLGHHPQLTLPIIKEIHYFDLHYDKAPAWYFAHFPLHYGRHIFITGEASPYYLFHPDVPQRVATHLPAVKLIVLLRDPVERAISHFRHNHAHGLETRHLHDAISSDLRRLEASVYQTQDTYAHRHHSYVARGLYYEQLMRWRKHFAAEQLLILKSENLFIDPRMTIHTILQFLGVEANKLPELVFPAYNHTDDVRDPVSKASIAVRSLLADYYAPHNERLATAFNVTWTAHEAN